MQLIPIEYIIGDVDDMKRFALFLWIPLLVFTIIALPIKGIFSSHGLIIKAIDVFVSPPGQKRLK